MAREQPSEPPRFPATGLSLMRLPRNFLLPITHTLRSPRDSAHADHPSPAARIAPLPLVFLPAAGTAACWLSARSSASPAAPCLSPSRPTARKPAVPPVCSCVTLELQCFPLAQG